MAEAQHALEDFLVVLTDERSGREVMGRRLGQFERSVLEFPEANHWVINL